MRPLGVRIIFELILGVVLVASLVLILRQSRRIAEYQRRQEADAQSLRLLREALRQKDLKRFPGGARGGAGGRTTMPASPRERRSSSGWIANWRKPAPPSPTSRRNFPPPMIKMPKPWRAPRNTCKSSRRIRRPNWTTCKRSLMPRVAQSDIARQRVAALEADNAKLKTDTAAATARAADVAHIIASLQDLDRRREVYLTSILRRYRDITGEFRAMSSMLDTSHDPNSGACGGAALSRIQNAVNSAEDDMRQLNELNARSQKLEKQLLKK